MIHRVWSGLRQVILQQGVDRRKIFMSFPISSSWHQSFPWFWIHPSSSLVKWSAWLPFPQRGHTVASRLRVCMQCKHLELWKSFEGRWFASSLKLPAPLSSKFINRILHRLREQSHNEFVNFVTSLNKKTWVFSLPLTLMSLSDKIVFSCCNLMTSGANIFSI